VCIATAFSSRIGNVQQHPGRRGHNDDRARVAHHGRSLMVADGARPGYAGDYYEPITIEIGLDVLQTAFRPSAVRQRCEEECVRAGFEAANAAMFAFQTAFAPMFETELAKNRDDRLGASKRAWQRVARVRLGRDLDDYAHSGASVTALTFHDGGATIGQVGMARAYRCRGGDVELLLPDQSVDPAATLPISGDGVPSAQLGVGATAVVRTRTVDIQPADRFILCTDGVWTVVSNTDLARACALPSPEAIRAEIDRAAHDAPDDVSIVVGMVVPVSLVPLR
jgi:hypothetical protein